MKKTFLLACVLTAFFAHAVFGQSAEKSKILGELYTEKNAGFSMRMPAGWATMDFNQKYLMVAGPADGGFTPNINFGDEAFAGTISEYLDAVVAQLSAFYANLEIIKQNSFTTAGGLKGGVITLTGQINQIHVRQKMYVIAHSNGAAVMVITGTAPVAGGEKYDALFDECVKTFDWKK